MDSKRMKSVIIAMTTPTSPEADAAFNQWMDEVHGPDLTETPVSTPGRVMRMSTPTPSPSTSTSTSWTARTRPPPSTT